MNINREEEISLISNILQPGQTVERPQYLRDWTEEELTDRLIKLLEH